MKHTLLLLALFSGACSAGAVTLTPAQSLARVQHIEERVPAMVTSTGANAQPSLVYTGATHQITAYYIFNRAEGGWMITGAQEEAAPLLGYADNGTFDASQMSPSMRWWLEGQALDIARAVNNPRPQGNVLRSPSRPPRGAIAPLTETRWNQEAPYNAQCPTVDGTKAPTGCVATAMAQVLKYHNYPPKGTGQHTYTYEGQTHSFDYGATTFDWNNMVPIYNASATAAQKAAVATLMTACGVSVDMQYGEEESGAVSQLIPSALRTYFGYDPAMKYETRQYYGLYDWEEMVYNQLKTVGPVLYGGQGDGGGHQFVCDGYSSDGYFHFNWGWGGMSDGYFLLYALDPESQGTGGSSLTGQGFSTQQGIVTGVRPAQDGTQPSPELGLTGAMSVEAQGASIIISGVVSNDSGETATNFSLGAIFTPTAGEGTFAGSASGQTYTLTPGEYTGEDALEYQVTPSGLSAGTYTMQPAVQFADGSISPLQIQISCPQHAIVTIGAEGNVTASLPTTGQITISNVQLVTPLYTEQPYKVTAQFANNSATEQLQVIRLGFATEGYDGLQLAAFGTMYPVDMLPGDEMDVTYISHIFKGSVTAGQEYQMVFFDENNQMLSTPQTVTFSTNDVTPSVDVSAWTVEGEDSAVDPDNIRVSGNITATGYWANNLYFVVLGTGNSIETYFASPYLFLNTGASTFDFTGSWTAAVPGKTYTCALCTEDDHELTPIGGMKRIKFSTSGMDSPVFDTAIPVYYNLQGQRLLNPQPGTLVIERRGDKARTILMQN